LLMETTPPPPGSKAMFVPSKRSWKVSLNALPTNSLYSSDPKTYEKNTFPVVDVKSKESWLKVPPPAQSSKVFGPATQAVVPVVKTIPVSNPTDDRPPLKVPAGPSVLFVVKVGLEIVIPAPAITLAKAVASEVGMTIGDASADAVKPNKIARAGRIRFKLNPQGRLSTKSEADGAYNPATALPF